jgi:hypothetical protein
VIERYNEIIEPLNGYTTYIVIDLSSINLYKETTSPMLDVGVVCGPHNSSSALSEYLDHGT